MDSTTVALYGAGALVLGLGVVSWIYPPYLERAWDMWGTQVHCAEPALMADILALVV